MDRDHLACGCRKVRPLEGSTHLISGCLETGDGLQLCAMVHHEPHSDPPPTQGQSTPEAHVQLRFEKFSAFVEEYWPKISLRGMLLETTQPKPVGTIISFEFKLTDGFRLCQGVGEVAWVRRREEGPKRPAGMGIRFHALDDQGRELILKILEEQVKSGGEPFEIERIPPGAESESVPPTLATPSERPTEEGWVRPPPREVEGRRARPPKPPGPTVAAVTPAPGGFQAPWEKLPEPSDVLDALDDSSVAATAETEVDADSSLAGFPVDPDRTETELQETDDEPLLLFAGDDFEPGEALPNDETVAERSELDLFGGDSSESELSFDLDEPSPGLEAPIEHVDEEPTVLLSKIDELARDDRLPSLDADADIQFDAESSAVFLDLNTSAAEPVAPLQGQADVEPEALEGAAASPGTNGIGDDGLAGLRSRPEDELAEGLMVSPASELTPLAEIGAAPSAPPELAPEPERLFPEIEAVPESESLPPFPEIEATPGPESPPPFPEINLAPEPESLLPVPDLEAVPETTALPAPEEAEIPIPTASSFLDRTASRLPVEETPEDDEAWGEDEESGPRLFLRDLKLAIAESWMRIAAVVVVLGLAGAAYFWYDEILQIAGFSSPSTREVIEEPPTAASQEPEAGGEATAAEEEPPPGDTGDVAITSDESGPELVEPQPPDAPVATPPPTAERPQQLAEPTVTPRPPAATPATQVTRITHEQTATGTLVTIWLDGELAADRFRHSELGYDPLKQQLTILGIQAPYRSQITVSTRELQQIRIGFHPGNELKLVFDLRSREVTLAELRNRGNRLEVLVSRR